MTVPTVGRVMLFRPASNTADAGFTPQKECAAIVAAVSPLGLTVNLSVFDGADNQHSRIDVPVVQDGDPEPDNGYYAYWMPYQVEQAKRSGQVSGGCGPTYTPPTEAERLSGLRYTAMSYANQHSEGKAPHEVIEAANAYFNWLKQ